MLEEGLASSILDAMEQPMEQAMRIMEKRQYAWAVGEINRPGVELDKLPDTPMITLALDIEASLAEEQAGLTVADKLKAAREDKQRKREAKASGAPTAHPHMGGKPGRIQAGMG